MRRLKHSQTQFAKLASAMFGMLIGLTVCCLAVCCLSVPRAASAQDKSLDAQLLDDLQPAPIKTTKPADDAPRRELDRGEDIGQEQREEHPLLKLGREMKQVQERIHARDTAAGTQQLQKSIAADLAKLIEKAKQPRNGNSAGKSGENKPGNSSTETGAESGTPSSRPGQQSTRRLEQGDSTETQMSDVKDALRRIWGHLPDKEREEMIGALGEQFLPKYERLIEAFYKRLAERPPGGP